MCFVLNYFNSFKALFQSKGLMIHKLFPSIEKILKQIGINFLIDSSHSNVLARDFIIKNNI